MSIRIVHSALVAFLLVTRTSAENSPAIDPKTESILLQWCHDGKVYSSVVKHSTWEGMPSWPDEHPNPPLSPRGAFAAAKRMFAAHLGFADDDKRKWCPARAELIATDAGEGQSAKWYWRLEFEGHPRVGTITIPPRIMAVVLMDGTAIVPVVSEVAEGEGCSEEGQIEHNVDE